MINLSIILQTGQGLFSSVSLTMAGENFQIYSVQITGKCICETFLHQSPCKTTPHKFVEKFCSPMQTQFKKKVPLLISWRRSRHFSLSSYLFSFLNLPSWCILRPFKQNYLETVFFKFIQYGYEIFQTVLNLNSKIIW